MHPAARGPWPSTWGPLRASTSAILPGAAAEGGQTVASKLNSIIQEGFKQVLAFVRTTVSHFHNEGTK
eukprot:2712279-Heterocapsa_arctica.AAC.1